MTFGYPCLALAPVAGLAGYCVAHVAACRLLGGGRPYRCLLLTFPAGLLTAVAATALPLAALPVGLADGCALFLFNLITYAALAYGYFQFVNTNVASLRIRMLQELQRSPDGLPAATILGRYDTREIVRRRIERLTAGGHLAEKDGRFYLGNRSFLVLARVIDALRRFVIGSPAKPARAAAGERPALPLEDRAGIDLTLFVACYNEQDNIVATLDTLLAALAEVACSWEIIIVDDASTDGSVAVIRDYQRGHPGLPIRLEVNERNRGLGRNYAECATRGRGTYYRLICGDNTEPRETLVSVFRQIGKADMVIPHHAHVPRRPLLRRALSRSYTMLVNGISGHRLRYYNGLAVHRRANVIRCPSKASGFGFQADLITRLLDEGATYVEIPAVALERTRGRSKALTLKNVLSVTRTLLGILGRRIKRAFAGPTQPHPGSVTSATGSSRAA